MHLDLNWQKHPFKQNKQFGLQISNKLIYKAILKQRWTYSYTVSLIVNKTS